MKKLIVFPIIFTLAFAAVGEDSPELGAASALREFMNGWNTGDNEALRGAIHYPFMTMFGPGQLEIAKAPEEFTVDFDQMRESSGWHHSSFDGTTILRATEDQVHVAVKFSRHNAAGEAYQSGNVFYIITKKGDQWRVQLRSGIAPQRHNAETETAARKVVDDFFVAWNNADNDAMHKVINFPHAFLIREGRVGASKGPSELVTNFDGMREREGWHESRSQDLKFIYSDANKAFADLTFTRHHTDGETYRTVPVLWIITKQNGHWGIQLRAILPAVEN